jgi:hypothetical protein
MISDANQIDVRMAPHDCDRKQLGASNGAILGGCSKHGYDSAVNQD